MLGSHLSRSGRSRQIPQAMIRLMLWLANRNQDQHGHCASQDLSEQDQPSIEIRSSLNHRIRNCHRCCGRVDLPDQADLPSPTRRSSPTQASGRRKRHTQDRSTRVP